MNIIETLGILIDAIMLQDGICDKDISTSDGDKLGKAMDVELDLTHGEVWVITENKGRWNKIPSEQIAKRTDKVVLYQGEMPVNQL